MSTEIKQGWCCPAAGRWALIRREWLSTGRVWYTDQHGFRGQHWRIHGAIIAASPDLSEAAVRLEASGIIWGIIRCCR